MSLLFLLTSSICTRRVCRELPDTLYIRASAAAGWFLSYFSCRLSCRIRAKRQSYPREFNEYTHIWPVELHVRSYTVPHRRRFFIIFTQFFAFPPPRVRTNIRLMRAFFLFTACHRARAKALKKNAPSWGTQRVRAALRISREFADSTRSLNVLRVIKVR